MCERLAQRLEEEKKDYESATLCYMCSPNGESLHGGACVFVCVSVCLCECASHYHNRSHSFSLRSCT